MANDNKKVIYGQSMYGGWYFNYSDGNPRGGEHAETLRELKEIARNAGVELCFRWDN